MKEIKFRGKRKDNGKWVFGSLVNSLYKHEDTGEPVTHIVTTDNCDSCFHTCDSDEEYFTCEDCFVGVDPATVGQYTGLNEKPFRTGKEIYGDDLVEVNTIGINHENKWIKGIVKFIDGCFVVAFCEPIYDFSTIRTRLYLKCFTENYAIKVIGNIHDNPELLEAES